RPALVHRKAPTARRGLPAHRAKGSQSVRPRVEELRCTGPGPRSRRPASGPLGRSRGGRRRPRRADGSSTLRLANDAREATEELTAAPLVLVQVLPGPPAKGPTGL